MAVGPPEVRPVGVPVPLQYSTQAWASSIVPDPMFTQM